MRARDYPFPSQAYRRQAPKDKLGIAAEAEWLAADDDARFMSEVALRLQAD